MAGVGKAAAQCDLADAEIPIPQKRARLIDATLQEVLMRRQAGSTLEQSCEVEDARARLPRQVPKCDVTLEIRAHVVQDAPQGGRCEPTPNLDRLTRGASVSSDEMLGQHSSQSLSVGTLGFPVADQVPEGQGLNARALSRRPGSLFPVSTQFQRFL